MRSTTSSPRALFALLVLLAVGCSSFAAANADNNDAGPSPLVDATANPEGGSTPDGGEADVGPPLEGGAGCSVPVLHDTFDIRTVLEGNIWPPKDTNGTKLVVDLSSAQSFAGGQSLHMDIFDHTTSRSSLLRALRTSNTGTCAIELSFQLRVNAFPSDGPQEGVVVAALELSSNTLLNVVVVKDNVRIAEQDAAGGGAYQVLGETPIVSSKWTSIKMEYHEVTHEVRASVGLKNLTLNTRILSHTTLKAVRVGVIFANKSPSSIFIDDFLLKSF